MSGIWSAPRKLTQVGRESFLVQTEDDDEKQTHNTEEIIRILRQADGGETAQAICREHNISEQTFYRWKKKYGAMELADAKRLKELEKENAELKKMLAESMLENRVLKEVNAKKW